MPAPKSARTVSQTMCRHEWLQFEEDGFTITCENCPAVWTPCRGNKRDCVTGADGIRNGPDTGEPIEGGETE